jgi:7-cyano-7-deazaguanine synthase
LIGNRAHEAASLLLLSGGVDSAALAARSRPAAALFVDYGQRSAPAEGRAAIAIAARLGLALHQRDIDLRSIGAGLLLSEDAPPASPSPEWWPYRNQMLVTIAAAVALRLGLRRVLVASVAGDGDRHADGSASFYAALNTVLTLQEGAIEVVAPALDETTEELVVSSGIAESVLAWTVSCHRSDLPCGNCPGCWKRERVLSNLGLLRPIEAWSSP